MCRKTSPYVPSYTIDDLIQAFYEPASTPTIRGIAYYTYLSELWRENQPVCQVAGHQPTPLTQDNRAITTTADQVHAASPRISAIDLCSMETASAGSDTMAQNASQTPVEAQQSTSSRQTATNIATTQTREQPNAETPPTNWQEVMQRTARDTVTAELTQWLERHITPQIVRTVQHTLQPMQQQMIDTQRTLQPLQQQLNDTQRQVLQVRQSLTDTAQRQSQRVSFLDGHHSPQPLSWPPPQSGMPLQ